MTLGVLGTMVWDRIEHPDGETVERWGGIAYSLAAAAAAAPEGWMIRPIIKLGHDLADEGRAFLDTVPGLELPGGVREVDEPNNRVHLRYSDRNHRRERLTGGVSGWGWPELGPRLAGLNGLYVNMISGFELDRGTATRVRDGFRAPCYIDLHSLVLDVADDGRRVPRRPSHAEEWLGTFEAVQMNETELAIIAGDEDAEAVPHTAVRRGARAVFVTRGPRGAGWFAPEDAPLWPASGRDGERDRAVGAEPSGSRVGTTGGRPVQLRSGEVELETPRSAGDPTGCGDVWGATCFVHLVQGRRLSAAMEEGNRAAARNVEHRGADGLYQQLRVDS